MVYFSKGDRGMRFIEPKYRWIIALGAISMVAFIGFSFLKVGSFGFPLDDGWIHQTYARNFAQTGEWAYIPGKTSGGSTSPLWTFLLSLVHLTRTGPFWGTFFIALVLFLSSGVLYQILANRIQPTGFGNWLTALPVFTLFFYFEWHIIWAAVSGMEIILYIFLILLFFNSLLQKKNAWLPGILIGLAFWTRPDGITLLGPLYFVLVLSEGSLKERWDAIWRSTVAFLPFIGAYFIFNRITAESWWPNTFYAKQSEYAILYEINLIQRILQLITQPWISASIVLLPGLVFILIDSIRRSKWMPIAMFLWAFGYVVVYAVRLPVIYQHARYLMPTMPVFYFLGLLGTLNLINRLNTSESQIRLIQFGAVTLVSVLLLGFWALGISAYSEDCAIIHEEMVTTSKWIKDNVSDDEVIAAHDIGALGYFASHDILDLAGLISPEVIPFIRDEDKLLQHLEKNDVQYLMTFSDWYDHLPNSGKVIYRSNGEAILRANGKPMTVYEYNWSED